MKTTEFYSFKKLFWAITFAAIPFTLLAAVLAAIGSHVIFFNEKPVVGLSGFITAILYLPLFSVLLSGFAWLWLNFGVLLFSVYEKLLKK